MGTQAPFLLVSNRGPAAFEYDAGGRLVAHRGGGGLVTALTGLVHHRDALWIASAMTEADVEASRRHEGGSFDCRVDDTTYRVRLVEPAAEPSAGFYTVAPTPFLCFTHPSLWPLSNPPHTRHNETEAFDRGY